MLSVNHLANCHNDDNIIFCKTDFILSEFNRINDLKKDVILITGNSDYPITDNIASLCPLNINRWYAANAVSNDPRIVPIPIGIENRFECKRNGHGIAFAQRYNKKYQIINDFLCKQIEPKKSIYANFSTHTNPQHREPIKKIILNTPHISWSEPTLSYFELYKEIFDHKMVVCPIGNGIDTHRLWETLYCNRIPIVITIDNYKIYELYSQLPIIMIDSIDKMLDPDYINTLYMSVRSRTYNLPSLLSIDYWQTMILNKLN